MERNWRQVDLSQLSPEETQRVLSVLRRDQNLRQKEEQRLLRLRSDLYALRKRGALKAGTASKSVQHQEQDDAKCSRVTSNVMSTSHDSHCARCLREFGLFNRGSPCPMCRKKVCMECRFAAPLFRANSSSGSKGSKGSNDSKKWTSADRDQQLWVCAVCHKQMQLKAMSGDWMKEFRRSASEKIKSPTVGGTGAITSATESLSRSIKESFRTGFMKKGSSFSQSQDETEVTLGLMSSGDHNANSSHLNGSVVQTPGSSSPSSSLNVRTRFMPPKLHTIDCASLPRHVPMLTRATGSESGPSPSGGHSGGGHSIFETMGSKDEPLPKMPPSPVLKVLQAAAEVVCSTASPGNYNHHQERVSKYEERNPLSRGMSEEKRGLCKKSSNRLMSDSSSESDSDDTPGFSALRTRTKQTVPNPVVVTTTSTNKSSSNESTPSPRTPNSFKILAGAAANTATAFKFPPSPSVYSGHSGHSGHSGASGHSGPTSRPTSERQSSDEAFPATAANSPYNSFRSRSTSSEMYEDTSGQLTTSGGMSSHPCYPVVSMISGLAPSPMPRTRRVSPLRKQRAIAEESPAPVDMVITTARPQSALDSGLSDSGHYTPTRSPRCSSAAETPVSSRQQSHDSASLSDTEDTVQGPGSGPGVIFRKVTIKKKEKSAFERALEAKVAHLPEPGEPGPNCSTSKPGTPEALVRCSENLNEFKARSEEFSEFREFREFKGFRQSKKSVKSLDSKAIVANNGKVTELSGTKLTAPYVVVAGECAETAQVYRASGQGEQFDFSSPSTVLTSCKPSSQNSLQIDAYYRLRPTIETGLVNCDKIIKSPSSCSSRFDSEQFERDQCSELTQRKQLKQRSCVRSEHLYKVAPRQVTSADCVRSSARPLTNCSGLEECHVELPRSTTATGSSNLPNKVQIRSKATAKLRKLSEGARRLRERLVACYGLSHRTSNYGLNDHNVHRRRKPRRPRSAACEASGDSDGLVRLVGLKAILVEEGGVGQVLGQFVRPPQEPEKSAERDYSVFCFEQEPSVEHIDRTWDSRPPGAEEDEESLRGSRTNRFGCLTNFLDQNFEPEVDFMKCSTMPKRTCDSREVRRRRVLMVRSRLEMSKDGTAYIEDSDWEMVSETSSLIGSGSVVDHLPASLLNEDANQEDDKSISGHSTDCASWQLTVEGQTLNCSMEFAPRGGQEGEEEKFAYSLFNEGSDDSRNWINFNPVCHPSVAAVPSEGRDNESRLLIEAMHLNQREQFKTLGVDQRQDQRSADFGDQLSGAHENGPTITTGFTTGFSGNCEPSTRAAGELARMANLIDRSNLLDANGNQSSKLELDSLDDNCVGRRPKWCEATAVTARTTSRAALGGPPGQGRPRQDGCPTTRPGSGLTSCVAPGAVSRVTDPIRNVQQLVQKWSRGCVGGEGAALEAVARAAHEQFGSKIESSFNCDSLATVASGGRLAGEWQKEEPLQEVKSNGDDLFDSVNCCSVVISGVESPRGQLTVGSEMPPRPPARQRPCPGGTVRGPEPNWIKQLLMNISLKQSANSVSSLNLNSATDAKKAPPPQAKVVVLEYGHEEHAELPLSNHGHLTSVRPRTLPIVGGSEDGSSGHRWITEATTTSANPDTTRHGEESERESESSRTIISVGGSFSSKSRKGDHSERNQFSRRSRVDGREEEVEEEKAAIETRLRRRGTDEKLDKTAQLKEDQLDKDTDESCCCSSCCCACCCGCSISSVEEDNLAVIINAANDQALNLHEEQVRMVKNVFRKEEADVNLLNCDSNGDSDSLAFNLIRAKNATRPADRGANHQRRQQLQNHEQQELNHSSVQFYYGSRSNLFLSPSFSQLTNHADDDGGGCDDNRERQRLVHGRQDRHGVGEHKQLNQRPVQLVLPLEHVHRQEEDLNCISGTNKKTASERDSPVNCLEGNRIWTNCSNYKTRQPVASGADLTATSSPDLVGNYKLQQSLAGGSDVACNNQLLTISGGQQPVARNNVSGGVGLFKTILVCNQIASSELNGINNQDKNSGEGTIRTAEPPRIRFDDEQQQQQPLHQHNRHHHLRQQQTATLIPLDSDSQFRKSCNLEPFTMNKEKGTSAELEQLGDSVTHQFDTQSDGALNCEFAFEPSSAGRTKSNNSTKVNTPAATASTTAIEVFAVASTPGASSEPCRFRNSDNLGDEGADEGEDDEEEEEEEKSKDERGASKNSYNSGDDDGGAEAATSSAHGSAEPSRPVAVPVEEGGPGPGQGVEVLRAPEPQDKPNEVTHDEFGSPRSAYRQLSECACEATTTSITAAATVLAAAASTLEGPNCCHQALAATPAAAVAAASSCSVSAWEDDDVQRGPKALPRSLVQFASQLVMNVVSHDLEDEEFVEPFVDLEEYESSVPQPRARGDLVLVTKSAVTPGRSRQPKELVDERSNLEKYYTFVLEGEPSMNRSKGERRPPTTVAMDSSLESCVDDEEDEEEEEDAYVQEECPDSDSSSGEDALYVVPERPMYGNPLTYSLHTIVEESERESDNERMSLCSESTSIRTFDSSSLPAINVTSVDDECEQEDEEMYKVARTQDMKSPVKFAHSRDMHEVPSEEEFSDSMSSAQYVYQDIEEGDPATMASSRLEKYFTSGLLGSVSFSYPEDAEFDEDEPTDDERGPVAMDTVKCQQSFVHSEAEQVSDKKGPNSVNLANHVPRITFAVQAALSDKESTCLDTVIDGREEECNLIQPSSEMSAKPDEIEAKEAANSSNVLPEDIANSSSCSKKTTVETASQVDSSFGEREVDHELSAFVNKLLAQVSSVMSAKSLTATSSGATNSSVSMAAPLRALEAQIAHLMQTVSPGVLSVANSSSNSSTIGSNNSDYGSDTLESSSEEDATSRTLSSDHVQQNQQNQKSRSSTSSASGGMANSTAFICQQLIGSLKSLAENSSAASASVDVATGEATSSPAVDGDPSSSSSSEMSKDVSKAKEAIAEKIVALMQSVQSSSRGASPALSSAASSRSGSKRDKCPKSNLLQADCSKSTMSIGKPPSESGSICASVSIPSYEGSECDAESVSREMDDLFASKKDEVSTKDVDEDKVSQSSFEARISLLGNERGPCEAALATKVDIPRPILNRTVIKIDSMATCDNSQMFESLKDRSFSSDSLSSVQTVKARKISAGSGHLASTDEEVDTAMSLKAKSEHNLVAAAEEGLCRPSGAKSTGNLLQLLAKSGLRDTGYYSFKSEESVQSLERPKSREALSSRPIIEVDEEEEANRSNDSSSPTRLVRGRRFLPSTYAKFSHSNSSILDPNAPGSTATLPSRPPRVSTDTADGSKSTKPNLPKRSRSNLFSTSGVLRKLLRDDNLKNGSANCSPRKLRTKLRSGLRTDSGTGVPQISVSDYSESFSARGSFASSNDVESPTKVDSSREDDIDRVIAYQSRSQTSLSSFGNNRSESMSSVYSKDGGRFGTVAVSGEILFGLSYNYKAGSMEVTVKECRNLAAADMKRGRSDPYVKVYLLPDRTKMGKRKTKTKKSTLNPVFDEVVKFFLTISEIESRSLWVSVWHSDTFGRNDFLGEVTLPLGHEVFDPESPGLKWYPLQERLESGPCVDLLSYKGDLFVALKFVPADMSSRNSVSTATRGELHILVKEAHNLIPTRTNGTSDPFVKSYFLPDRTKNGKQKSSVVKKSCSPKWNHTFIYDDLSLGQLKSRCVELTLWDKDKLGSNSFLGGVRLGLGLGQFDGQSVEWADSVGDEVALWQQMLDKANMWVYGELRLRPTMQTRR